MQTIKRGNFYYLGHSFRKDGKVVHRERYLGKQLPKDLDERKMQFLHQCMQEDLFIKLKIIKLNYDKEWKRYPESVKKKVLLDFAIDFTYNSNAIEGSKITLDETEDIIKRKIAPHKSLEDIQETIEYAKVFFKILHTKKITQSLLLEWHKEMFSQTKPDIAGKVRDYGVKVGNYTAPDWQDLKSMLKEFFQWYNAKKTTMNPVELAARAHYKFEKIHPFGDGNGRVGRLLTVHILRAAKYPLLGIEYKKRKSYYHALTKPENDFMYYFMRRYLKAYNKYLK